jgi:tellurite resistance protein TehA-like permease
MNQAMKLEELRELFLTAPESEAARILAVTCSFVLVTVVLWLVYRGVLREEYTPIWMGVAFALVVVSLRLDLLNKLTRAIGGWTPSSTIFFLGEVFLVVICLNYAVRLSRTSVQMKNLAQEIALLRVMVDQGASRRESEVPAEDVS